MDNIARVRRVNPQLAQTIQDRGGFILDSEVPQLVAIDRMMMVMVRCGNGRFICPIQNVAHFITIIEEHAKMKQKETGNSLAGDHIRDVSLMHNVVVQA